MRAKDLLATQSAGATYPLRMMGRADHLGCTCGLEDDALFLKHKMDEHDALKAEMEVLKVEMRTKETHIRISLSSPFVIF